MLEPRDTPLNMTLASPSTELEPGSPSKESMKEKKKKMIITGDDILIEYVSRIIKVMDSLLSIYQAKSQQNIDRIDEIMPQQLRYCLEKFN